MSIYLSVDNGPGQQIASNKGWGDFSRWVQTLDGFGELAHLCDHGWSQKNQAVADELKRALKGCNDHNVKSVGQWLVQTLGMGDVCVVNDGMGPDIGG